MFEKKMAEEEKEEKGGGKVPNRSTSAKGITPDRSRILWDCGVNN